MEMQVQIETEKIPILNSEEQKQLDIQIACQLVNQNQFLDF